MTVTSLSFFGSFKKELVIVDGPLSIVDLGWTQKLKIWFFGTWFKAFFWSLLASIERHGDIQFEHKISATKNTNNRIKSTDYTLRNWQCRTTRDVWILLAQYVFRHEVMVRRSTCNNCLAIGLEHSFEFPYCPVQIPFINVQYSRILVEKVTSWGIACSQEWLSFLQAFSGTANISV